MSAMGKHGTRLCEICGKPYSPRTERQLYCSVGCREEANRRRSRENMRKLRARRAAEFERKLFDVQEAGYGSKNPRRYSH